MGSARGNIGICAAVVLTLCGVFVSKVRAQEQSNEYVNRQAPMVHMAGLLRLVETIPIPTEGYMDHLTYDLKNQHLFLSAENNKKIVVVDMKAGKVIHETKVGGNPRKPFFDPASNKLWVDLGDNTVVALNGDTFEVTTTIELTGGKNAPGRDPDNAAFDAAKGLYYVAVRTRSEGSKEASIEIVDTKAAKLIGSIKMEGQEPAGIVLDPAANRLYAGMGDVVNGESVVKVVDTAKRAIVAEWSTAGGPQPHVAGLDAAHHRLFMGSRLGGGHNVDPGKLVIINTDTGKVVETLDATGGGDEIFYDAPSKRVYFSGSTGTLAVFHEDDPDHFQLLGKVPTGAIAKSGIWIPELKRYYAAVPKHLVQLMPATQYGVRDWITEEAHLMVFEEIP
ncbi:MAG TPA: YncE family protein [Verrucomicrobiae bacterium]|jgi:DNA-binding beta-propeller fold protein YncE|nr:YncE family protein [Verrucomicrobiae bacterium]